MTRAALQLEVFEPDPCDSPAPDPAEAEAQHARGYEDGYGAGWQDALAQLRDEDSLRRAAAEEALQTLAFSYLEATAALEGRCVALAQALMGAVLPELAQVALPRLLAQELQTLAARELAGRLQIQCAPSARATVQGCLAAVPALDAAIVEEPSFTDAQVVVQVDHGARRIDLDGVRAALADALGTDPQLPQEDAPHG